MGEIGRFCPIRGSSGVREGWAKPSDLEEGQGDGGLSGAEAEGDAVQEPQAGIGGLDASVGQAEVERSVDAFEVAADPAAELDEGSEAGMSGPGEPLMEELEGIGRLRLNNGA
jgi:hypothetical protein